MTYNEIMYTAFLNELDKQAGIAIPSIGKIVAGAKGIANKVMYNPTTFKATNFIANHGGDINAMAATAGGHLGGMAAKTIGTPRLGSALQTMGSGIADVYKALPAG